jgi:hypothetical protein
MVTLSSRFVNPRLPRRRDPAGRAALTAPPSR